MTQKNRKASASMPLNMGSIMMRAAGVLLCLVLFSVHLMGGLYARYTSGGFAEDEARVAKFDINVVGAPADALEVSCVAVGSKNDTYAITIQNRSEVAVTYDIVATVKEKAGQPELKGVSAVVTPASGTLEAGTTSAAGNTSATAELSFDVDWLEFVGGDPIDTPKTIDATFSVTVRVEQVD